MSRCNSHAKVVVENSIASSDFRVALGQSQVAANLVSSREKIEFDDNEAGFPVHRAVVCSKGDLNEFREMTKGIDLAGSTANTMMRLRKTHVTTTKESMNAAQFAYALGYRDLGDHLVQKLRGSRLVLEDAIVTAKARSVMLSKYDDVLPVVQAVKISEGHVDRFEGAARDLVGEGGLSAIFQAEVVRFETISEHLWLPIQLAAALKYTEVAAYLANF